MGTTAPYAVEVRDGDRGWRVSIVEPSGRVVSERRCRDGAEARTYASTVRQHLYWLSDQKFREYYRIEGSRGSGSEREQREPRPQAQE